MAALLSEEAALAAAAAALGARLRARGLRLATAESCTGGLIAALCTSVAGASDWFAHGIVSYANTAKAALLGVDPALLAAHGAVSEPVARAMARGALAVAGSADVAVAVTGIAGPGGGSAAKPVGLVWLALAWQDAAGTLRDDAWQQVFPGDRTAVRSATVQWGLDRLDAWLDANHGQA